MGLAPGRGEGENGENNDRRGDPCLADSGHPFFYKWLNHRQTLFFIGVVCVFHVVVFSFVRIGVVVVVLIVLIGFIFIIDAYG